MSTIGAIGAAARLASFFFERLQKSSVLQSQAYLREHRIDFDTTLKPGFINAGRRAVIDNAGTVTNACREIITFKAPVDDPVLLHAMVEFRRQDDPSADRITRARGLVDFVHSKMSIVPASMVDEVIASLHGGRLSGRSVSLGDLIDNGTGVSRHLALLMKVLADDVGIPMSMVRGRMDIDGSRQGHAWNEIVTEGSEVYVVDATTRSVFPGNSAQAAPYHGLDGVPCYVVQTPDISADDLAGLEIKAIHKADRDGVAFRSP